MQRFFTRTISGIKDLPYSDRLKNLGLETRTAASCSRFGFFTRNYMDFVTCRYLLHLQIAQHDVVIVLNLLSLAAIVMFGNIFSCRIVDIWNSLSDAVVKSASVASFKNNMCAVDLSRFLTVVQCYVIVCVLHGMLVALWDFAFFTLKH